MDEVISHKVAFYHADLYCGMSMHFTYILWLVLKFLDVGGPKITKSLTYIFHSEV